MGGKVSKEAKEHIIYLEEANVALKRKLKRQKKTFHNEEKELLEKENQLKNQSLLLTYQNELLREMLACEHMESFANEERMEALKLELLEQGGDRKYINQKINNNNNNDYINNNNNKNDKNKDIFILTTEKFNDTLDKILDVFDNNDDNHLRDSIVECFHELDPSESGTLSPLSFSHAINKWINESNDLIHLDQNEINMLMIKFFDGNIINYIDFMDFFIGKMSSKKFKKSVNALLAYKRFDSLKLRHSSFMDDINDENDMRSSTTKSKSLRASLTSSPKKTKNNYQPEKYIPNLLKVIEKVLYIYATRKNSIKKCFEYHIEDDNNWIVSPIRFKMMLTDAFPSLNVEEKKLLVTRFTKKNDDDDDENIISKKLEVDINNFFEFFDSRLQYRQSSATSNLTALLPNGLFAYESETDDDSDDDDDIELKDKKRFLLIGIQKIDNVWNDIKKSIKKEFQELEKKEWEENDININLDDENEEDNIYSSEGLISYEKFSKCLLKYINNLNEDEIIEIAEEFVYKDDLEDIKYNNEDDEDDDEDDDDDDDDDDNNNDENNNKLNLREKMEKEIYKINYREFIKSFRGTYVDDKINEIQEWFKENKIPLIIFDEEEPEKCTFEDGDKIEKRKRKGEKFKWVVVTFKSYDEFSETCEIINEKGKKETNVPLEKLRPIPAECPWVLNDKLVLGIEKKKKKKDISINKEYKWKPVIFISYDRDTETCIVEENTKKRKKINDAPLKDLYLACPFEINEIVERLIEKDNRTKWNGCKLIEFDPIKQTCTVESLKNKDKLFNDIPINKIRKMPAECIFEVDDEIQRKIIKDIDDESDDDDDDDDEKWVNVIFLSYDRDTEICKIRTIDTKKIIENVPLNELRNIPSIEDEEEEEKKKDDKKTKKTKSKGKKGGGGGGLCNKVDKNDVMDPSQETKEFKKKDKKNKKKNDSDDDSDNDSDDERSNKKNEQKNKKKNKKEDKKEDNDDDDDDPLEDDDELTKRLRKLENKKKKSKKNLKKNDNELDSDSDSDDSDFEQLLKKKKKKKGRN